MTSTATSEATAAEEPSDTEQEVETEEVAQTETSEATAAEEPSDTEQETETAEVSQTEASEVTAAEEPSETEEKVETEEVSQTETSEATAAEEPSDTEQEDKTEKTTQAVTSAVTTVTTAEETEDTSPAGVDRDGTYTSPEDVAEYIHTFGTLPSNFISKKQLKKLGWTGGDVYRYADGKSIGGDRFGNYEGQLPDGDYKECDVNYFGGKRGAERIVWSDEGIYYTDDHYETFTQLY
ncbi:MAG: ribonuclease [Oscillospiraceae bacterium]|nr:ribonuclease [Oscillospiraceae bacterium]